MATTKISFSASLLYTHRWVLDSSVDDASYRPLFYGYIDNDWDRALISSIQWMWLCLATGIVWSQSACSCWCTLVVVFTSMSRYVPPHNIYSFALDMTGEILPVPGPRFSSMSPAWMSSMDTTDRVSCPSRGLLCLLWGSLSIDLTFAMKHHREKNTTPVHAPMPGKTSTFQTKRVDE